MHDNGLEEVDIEWNWIKNVEEKTLDTTIKQIWIPSEPGLAISLLYI